MQENVAFHYKALFKDGMPKRVIVDLGNQGMELQKIIEERKKAKLPRVSLPFLVQEAISRSIGSLMQDFHPSSKTKN